MGWQRNVNSQGRRLTCGFILHLGLDGLALVLRDVLRAAHHWLCATHWRPRTRSPGSIRLLLLLLPLAVLHSLGIRQEVGELIKKVRMAAEEHRDLVVDRVDGLLPLAVHVEDLKELLVDTVVVGEAVLDLVHIVDGLVELNWLLLDKLDGKRKNIG